MRKIIHLFLSLLLCTNIGLFSLHAQINDIPRAIPETEGVSTQIVKNLFDSLVSLPKTDIHSVMVIRNGKVIGEIYPKPFSSEYQHTMYSCSKTFVSVAIGLAIQDSLLRLDDRIAVFFPDLLPDSISPTFEQITIRHLLTMTSGIIPDWNLRNTCTDWLRSYLNKPVNAPGIKFMYDSMCSYILSAIVQKVSSLTLLDYLKQKIFIPMNIHNVEWELSPEGINTGGWGLYIQSESLAKLGMLLLQRGRWNNCQLLDESWVDQMVSSQFGNYGYHVWKCSYPTSYRADGAFGQYIIVVPEKQVVIVITGCSRIDGKIHRELVWNNFLPYINEGTIPLSSLSKEWGKIQDSYAYPFISGMPSSSYIYFLKDKKINLSKNKYNWKNLSLAMNNKNELVLVIEDISMNKYSLKFGYKKWLTHLFNSYPPYTIQAKGRFKGLKETFFAAGNYAWTNSNSIQLQTHFVNWISSLDIVINFRDDEVELFIQENTSDKIERIKGFVD